MRCFLTDRIRTLFCQFLKFFHELLWRHTIFGPQPALHGAYHRVSKKIQNKFVYLFASEQAGNALGYKRPNILLKVIAEGILSFDLQGFAVERMVLVKVAVNLFNKSPPFRIASTQVFVLENFNKFRIKNPIYKVIFILEVIVEGIPAHFAVPGDISHGNIYP